MPQTSSSIEHNVFSLIQFTSICNVSLNNSIIKGDIVPINNLHSFPVNQFWGRFITSLSQLGHSSEKENFIMVPFLFRDNY